MGWRDRETETQDKGQDFPFVQWVNRGGYLDPRSKTGGFFMTVDQLSFAGLDAADFGTPADLHFSSGDMLSGVFAPAISLAPLTKRFSWVAKTPDGKYSYSDKYFPGARGKLQMLCRIKVGDVYSLPVMLTLTGTITMDLQNALKAHVLRVKSATRGQAPSAFFYMTLQAGEPVQRGKSGQSSLVTPMQLVDGDFDPDTHYVGDHVADDIEANWAEYEAWAEKWGAQDDDEEAMPSASAPQGPPPDYAARAPGDRPTPATGRTMMDARNDWSAAWNTAKGKGLKVGLLNNAWNIDEIDTATVYMNDAIAGLDNGDDRAEIQGYLDAALANIGAVDDDIPF